MAGKSLVKVLAEAMELERHGPPLPYETDRPCTTCLQYARAQAKALRKLYTLTPKEKG